jgi:hypothetical protein
MPITRKGPGNPGKVASKMTKTSTGKLKNVFTNISAKMKAEQAGRDQVKKYKESLKQKKLAEQKAQKDLQLKERGGQRGKMSVSKEVKVKPKEEKAKLTGGKSIVFRSKGQVPSDVYSRMTPTDSSMFMNLAKLRGGDKLQGEYLNQMKKELKKNPKARFRGFKMNTKTGEGMFQTWNK